MSTSTQLRSAFANLANVPDEAIDRATSLVETIAAAHGGTVTLGKRGRRRTYRLRAITKRDRSDGKTVAATVYGTPTGPWVWKNTGTRGHRIPRYRSGRLPVLGGANFDHPVSNGVDHPGTGGGRAWAMVRNQAEHDVPPIFVDAVHDALRAVV